MNNKAQLDHTETNFLVATALGNVFSDFIGDRDISGVRSATLTFYENELKLFLKWSGETGAKELSDITPDLLRAYFLDLRKRRHQNGIHKNYTAVKTLLRWAWEEYEQAGICPITKVKVASPQTKPQPAISLENFSKILDICRDKNGSSDRDIKRDRAILLFLLDTGIRRMELCRLKVVALRSDGTVHLEADGTKTGESRNVFLTRETRRAVKSYLVRRQNLLSDDPLFATQNGEHFTAAGLRQIIRRRCKEAGIQEQGMHSFRRGFALESLRAGADLISISRILGHKHLETTRRYLPQTDEDIHLVHDRTSPINKIKHKNSR